MQSEKSICQSVSQSIIRSSIEKQNDNISVLLNKIVTQVKEKTRKQTKFIFFGGDMSFFVKS